MKYADITNRMATLGADKWAVHFRGRQLQQQGHDIIELTIGEPDLPPDRTVIETMNQAALAGRIRYSVGRGEPELLDALAEKYSARSGRKFSPENFLTFPGTQTALFTVMMGVVDAGDAVLVADPLYATYEGVIRSPGADMIAVATHSENGFRLTRDALENAVTPACKALLLNTPHNPTGTVYTYEDIAAIGEFAITHDLWIISDEVYENLIFDGEFASPLDDEKLAERTIVVSSISKSHAAPGLRSGWAVGPAEFCKKLLPISETMLFGNQPFIADATTYALRHIHDTAVTMRQSYQSRAEMICQRLQETPLIEALMPQSGMFILIDVSNSGISGDDFADRFLTEHHVAVMPGSSFGDAAKNFIRLSLTVPDDKLAETCTRLLAFCKSL